MGLNWLDIAIILILLFGALNGMSKGLIASVFNIAGTIISLIAAKYLSVPLAQLIIKYTGIYSALKGLFEKRMGAINPYTLQLLKIINSKNVSIADTLTVTFINIASFICIFFIATIILNMIRDSLKFTIRRTPLKYIDSLGGLVIGLIKSAVFIFIFFAAVTPIMGIMPQKNSLVEAISTSKFASYFFYYNFIFPWFQSIQSVSSLLKIKL